MNFSSTYTWYLVLACINRYFSKAMAHTKIKENSHPALYKAHLDLYEGWVPHWFALFSDTEYGGFHERLSQDGKALDIGYRRLVTQCRQIYVYAHADMTTGQGHYRKKTESAFAYLIDNYHVPATGGWKFSIKPDGKIVDATYDLYGHAFVVFCLTYYYRLTGDEKALELAKQTLEFINTAFRVQGIPGFAEGLDENCKPLDKIRRQDPHMHLFEACLFMYRVTSEKSYLELAKEIMELFTGYFWSESSGTLPEYYDAHLKPHPDKGDYSQPGHHFQWVWLLEKFQETRRKPKPEYFDLMKKLYVWADKHGFDMAYGGIYDALDMRGEVLEDTKRIWPIMEALKAYPSINRLMNDPHYCTRRAGDLVTLLRAHYIREDGTWVEHLSRDMKPITNYMPGTTPYHIYLGIAALSEIE